jgi:hypothetical protein
MSVREKDDPVLYARIQERNLLRQYDLLANCIEIGLKKGIESFDKYTLWALNYAAVANIAQFGGRYREEPIYVGGPPPTALQGSPEPHGPVLFSHSRELGSFRPSHIAFGIRIVAAQLDPSFCRGQRSDRKGGVLLPALPEAWAIAQRDQDCP